MNIQILRQLLGGTYLNADPKQKVDPDIFIGMDHWAEVFGNDRKLWELLTEISGESGIPAIITKQYETGSYIIKTGDFDQKLVGMLHGEADILRQNKKFETFKLGNWLGELAITNFQPRRTDVYVKKGPVTVIEIAWSIADITLVGFMFGSLVSKIACAKLDRYLKEIESLKIGFENVIHEFEKFKQISQLPVD